jgi:predicted porin
MKNSIVALAVLALFGTASAQPTVTLFGVVDATLARGTGSLTDRTQLTNSGYTVSLAGGWGEVRLGRDYTPQFWNQSHYDPFNTNGVGTNQVANSNIGGLTNTRPSNSISYLWGHGFNASSAAGGDGFHALVQYYLGENPSGTATSDDGSGWGVRAGYNGGPVNVAAHALRARYTTGDITSYGLGGSYDFGPARVMAMAERDRVAAATAVTGKGYLVGVHVPVGAHLLRAAVSQYKANAATEPATRKFAIGYVYNMSKRTALYTSVARVSNKGAAAMALNGSTTAAGASSSGFDVGVRHTF